MKKLASVLSTWLICATIMILGGCKTKKAVQVESMKRTFDSMQVIKERSNVKYSLIDTSRVDEYTTLIREYIFDTPSCFTDAPMVEYKGNGSVVINHGLKSIKETKISRKNEKKGVSVQKDSTAKKVTRTKVHATEQHKQKQRHVEQIAVSKPFDFWQLVIGASILFAVAIALCYLYKRVPSVRNVVQRIIDRVRKSS